MNEIEKALQHFKSRKNMGISDHIQKYEDLAISALEAQRVDRWIPVSESVPIVDNLVLCCVDGAVITGYYHEGWYLGRFNTGPVTHWKWMPDPWKEAT